MRARGVLRAASVAVLFAVLAGQARGGVAVGVQVFTLKFKHAEEATLLVRPLLSDAGSILLQPKLNALTVTDTPAVLNRIGKALARFDVPPRGFSIAVKIVRAQADAPAGDAAHKIGDVGDKLREVFPFKGYSLVDAAVLAGSEGDGVSHLLGGRYRVEFHIDPVGQGSSVLRLSRFSLSRERPRPGGGRASTLLFRTTLNLALNQTLVLAASKDEASKQALIVILLAQEASPPAGKGAAGLLPAENRR
jgi:hypothetical protein